MAAEKETAKRLNVIVVGAGPSGLLLALLLTQHGLNVHVVEAEPGLSSSPRAAHYAPPAVQYLRQAGVADEVRAQGILPDVMSWRKLDGTRIAGLDLRLMDDDPDRLVCLPVDSLTELLLKHVQRQQRAHVSWQHKVVGTGQDSEKAWVDVETPDGLKKLEADYIVGCDGGNSSTRRSLFGREFPGKTWEVQLVATNVYFEGEGLYAHGYNDVNTILDPIHPNMCARITQDGLWRVSYGEESGLSREELIARQPAKFEAFLPGHPKPHQYKIVGINPYMMHQRLAESMHKGRFLLAGDAAHLCTPFGGLGLTGGLVDAGNLADCLGAMQHMANGGSSVLSADHILAEYSRVRRKRWLDVTNPISSSNLERLITVDADRALEQDEFLGALAAAEAAAAAGNTRPGLDILRGAYELSWDVHAWLAEKGVVLPPAATRGAEERARI